jgi:hypothetical protein
MSHDVGSLRATWLPGTIAVLLSGLALGGGSALANDSTAELAAGGLVLTRSDVIMLESEDLFVSKALVTVDYVFRNTGDADVETVVAFPMPDIVANPDGDVSVPDNTTDNFLDFSTVIDGVAVVPQLEQRALVAGIDVTDDLIAQGVPLLAFLPDTRDRLNALPDAVAAHWATRGVIRSYRYDDGTGEKDAREGLWTVKTTFWWRATFPAGKAVAVSHRYRPSIGGSLGLNFQYDGPYGRDSYVKTYCLDGSLERAVEKAEAAGATLFESRLAYVLMSGGNWSNGVIGRFHLTVDKGTTDDFVSFCAGELTGEEPPPQGLVKKTGPTGFEMTLTDFVPARDLNVLFVERVGNR